MGSNSGSRSWEPSRSWAWVLLVSLSLPFYLGLGGWSLLDWDEINFAESAREMLESGDYTSVQVNYQPFYEKPPVFMWLQAASMRIFGVGERSARLPNALLGTLYLLTLYAVGTRWVSPGFGLLWALLLWATLLPHAYFKSGIIDPLFNYEILLSIFFGVGACTDALQGRSPAGKGLAAGLASGFAVLTKGPVGFLLWGLVMGLWLFQRRAWTPMIWQGLIWFVFGCLVPVGLWVGLEWYARGSEQLLLFWQYMVSLFRTGVAGHEQPFYYHALVLLVGCFPAMAFAVPFLFRSLRSLPGNQGAVPLLQAMQVLFWVVLILFSLSTTKIIHYSSLAYVPLCALGAAFLDLKKQEKVWPSAVVGLLGLQVVLWWGLLSLLPWAMRFRELWAHRIADSYVRAALEAGLPWSGWESLWVLPLPWFIYRGWKVLRRGNPVQGVLWMGSGVSLLVLGLSLSFLPRIASVTQGPAVEFYRSLQGQKVYAGTWGFKSYAPFFYMKIPFQGSGTVSSMPVGEALLQVPLDRPVYLIARVDRLPDTTALPLRWVGARGGYVFYRRSR